MERNTVLLKQADHIATVMFNRPHRHNAMNEEMWHELIPVLQELARDDEVRVVVLTGAGRDFCVGADLGTGEGRERVLEETNAEEARRSLAYSQNVVRLLHGMEKPTIAMINGVAAGGGFDWALACDIRIASATARFRSFTQIGLLPGQAGAWFMVHLMGYPKACQMLFTADIINAQQAYEMGLLNKVVPPEELERETYDLARRMAAQAPIALRLGKLLLRKATEMDLDTALEMAAAIQPICITSQDAQEAIRAFREKRAPSYKGK